MENYTATLQEISTLARQVDTMFLSLSRLNVIEDQIVNNTCSIETLGAIDPNHLIHVDEVPSVESIREFTVALFRKTVEFIKKMIKRLKLLFVKVKHVFKTKDKYVKVLIKKLNAITEVDPSVYTEKFKRPDALVIKAGEAINVLFFQLFNFEGVDPNLPKFSVKLKTFGQSQFIPSLNLPSDVAGAKAIFDESLKGVFKMDIVEVEPIEFEESTVKVFDIVLDKEWDVKETSFDKKTDPLFDTKKDLDSSLSLMRDVDSFDEALDRYNKRFELMDRQLQKYVRDDDDDRSAVEGLIRLWKHHTKTLTHISSNLTMLVNSEVSGTIAAANVVLKHSA